MLGDGNRRDVVARVGVVRSQEGVVVVEFTDRDAVRPGGPLGGDALFDAEDLGPLAAGGGAVGQGLGPAATIGARFSEAMATEALSMTRLITMSVTSSVTSDGIRGDLGDLVGELLLAGQVFLALVNADVVFLDHGAPCSEVYACF